MKETTNFGASTMKTLHGDMLTNNELLFANKVTLTYRGNIFYPLILDTSSPLLKDDADSDVKNELYALNAEISQFGVILDKKTVTNLGITLSYLGPTDRAKFYEVWIEAIRRSKGADKNYTPFYPGFPQQVRELSEFEWMFNAICHYISDGEYFTTEKERIQYTELKKNRKFSECLEDMKVAKPIGVSTLDDVQKIAYSIMAAPTSISDFDKEIINFFIENIYDEYIDTMPEMNFKENMCYVLSKLMTNDLNKRCTPKNIGASIKTATDVLRLYVALSGGDISLAKSTKFKNLPNWQYRLFAELINGMNFRSVYEDMFRYPEMWKRANEKIHPKRFKEGTYTKVADLLYKGEKPITFMTKFNKAFEDGDEEALITLLSQRPGVFARYLDCLVRLAYMHGVDANEAEIYRIINAFKKVSASIDTRLLLQVKNHFIDRLDHVTTNGYTVYDEDVERYFINKNGKVFMKTEDHMWNIPEKYLRLIIGVIDDAIKAQYATRDIIGPVYIDPSVDGLLVPWNQRTVSTKSKCVVKGSKWKLKDTTNIIRAFCWWTNTDDGVRVDEDISATFVNNFSPAALAPAERCSENVYYGNIHNSFCVHSGDIVNGGPADGMGACEFIDIDIDKALEAGYRYAFVSIHSFTANPFNSFNTTAGFMERSDAKMIRSGEGSRGNTSVYNFSIFDPRTVELNFDLDTDSNASVPILIDLRERYVYWIDSNLDVSGIINCRNSVNLASISIDSLLKRHFTTIRELVELNAAVRGGLTDTPDDAKTIVTATETEEIEGKTIISAYELDKIMNII